MYYILWFVGVIAICLLSAYLGLRYEKLNGDDK